MLIELLLVDPAIEDILVESLEGLIEVLRLCLSIVSGMEEEVILRPPPSIS